MGGSFFSECGLGRRSRAGQRSAHRPVPRNGRFGAALSRFGPRPGGSRVCRDSARTRWRQLAGSKQNRPPFLETAAGRDYRRYRSHPVGVGLCASPRQAAGRRLWHVGRGAHRIDVLRCDAGVWIVWSSTVRLILKKTWDFAPIGNLLRRVNSTSRRCRGSKSGLRAPLQSGTVDATENGYQDKRVKAVVAAVPVGAVIDPASLRTPRVPTALISAELDTLLAPRWHVLAIEDACKPCVHLATLKQGGHMSILSPCPILSSRVSAPGQRTLRGSTAPPCPRCIARLRSSSSATSKP